MFPLTKKSLAKLSREIEPLMDAPLYAQQTTATLFPQEFFSAVEKAQMVMQNYVVPLHYKTKLCKSTLCNRVCPQGHNCPYAHSELALWAFNLRENPFFKMKLCRHGSNCRFWKYRCCRYVHPGDLSHRLSRGEGGKPIHHLTHVLS